MLVLTNPRRAPRVRGSFVQRAFHSAIQSEQQNWLRAARNKKQRILAAQTKTLSRLPYLFLPLRLVIVIKLPPLRLVMVINLPLLRLVMVIKIPPLRLVMDIKLPPLRLVMVIKLPPLRLVMVIKLPPLRLIIKLPPRRLAAVMYNR